MMSLGVMLSTASHAGTLGVRSHLLRQCRRQAVAGEDAASCRAALPMPRPYSQPWEISVSPWEYWWSYMSGADGEPWQRGGNVVQACRRQWRLDLPYTRHRS